MGVCGKLAGGKLRRIAWPGLIHYQYFRAADDTRLQFRKRPVGVGKWIFLYVGNDGNARGEFQKFLNVATRRIRHALISFPATNAADSRDEATDPCPLPPCGWR